MQPTNGTGDEAIIAAHEASWASRREELNLAEVRTITGYSRETVKRHLGHLGHQISRRQGWRIAAEDLKAYLESLPEDRGVTAAKLDSYLAYRREAKHRAAGGGEVN